MKACGKRSLKTIKGLVWLNCALNPRWLTPPVRRARGRIAMAQTGFSSARLSEN